MSFNKNMFNKASFNITFGQSIRVSMEISISVSHEIVFFKGAFLEEKVVNSLEASLTIDVVTDREVKVFVSCKIAPRKEVGYFKSGRSPPLEERYDYSKAISLVYSTISLKPIHKPTKLLLNNPTTSITIENPILYLKEVKE